MATPDDLYRLRPSDLVYRVIEHDQWEIIGGLVVIKPDAFEDPQVKDPETLSFFVNSHATPAGALEAISKRSQVRKICGTGKEFPTPEKMYEAAYRVAVLDARLILEAIRNSSGLISIEQLSQGEISSNGHLGLIGGHAFSDTWARSCRMLSRSETLGGEAPSLP